MAKYTQLLSEYLQDGGALPSIFDEVEGFSDLFIGRYCDHEIGYETPVLFEMKLNHYANLYVPHYKERITALKNAWQNAQNPNKQTQTTIQGGERVGAVTELPINTTTATPSSTTKADAFTDTNTTTETGMTALEAYAVMDAINKNVAPLLEELLDKFKPCFMGVY